MRALYSAHNVTGDIVSDTSANANGGALNQTIRVDAPTLLTGIVGMAWLVMSWVLVVYSLFFAAMAVYVGVTHDLDPFGARNPNLNALQGAAADAVYRALLTRLPLASAGGLVLSMTVRWLSAGVLQARMGRTIVCCIAMLVSAAITVYAISMGTVQNTSTQAAIILWGFAAVFVSVVVIVSFRNRRHWGQRT